MPHIWEQEPKDEEERLFFQKWKENTEFYWEKSKALASQVGINQPPENKLIILGKSPATYLAEPERLYEIYQKGSNWAISGENFYHEMPCFNDCLYFIFWQLRLQVEEIAYT